MKPMEFVAIVEGDNGMRYGGDEEGTLWRLDKLQANGIPYKVLKPLRDRFHNLRWLGLGMVVTFFIIMTAIFLFME